MRCGKLSLGFLVLFYFLAYLSAADTSSAGDLELALKLIENSLKISKNLSDTTQQLRSLQMSEGKSLEDLLRSEMILSQLTISNQASLSTYGASLENYQTIYEKERSLLQTSKSITQDSAKILQQQEKRFSDTLGGKLLLFVGIPVAVGIAGYGVGYIMGSM